MPKNRRHRSKSFSVSPSNYTDHQSNDQKPRSTNIVSMPPTVKKHQDQSNLATQKRKIGTGEAMPPLSVLEKYAPPIANALLVASNLGASFLVSNSDMVLRSLVITPGSIAKWVTGLGSILEKGPREDMSPENFGLCCIGYTLALMPAVMYPLAGSDVPGYIGPVLALLSIAAPVMAEFLMRQYALNKTPDTPGPLSWQNFFSRRTQIIKLIGGVSDIAFNNVLASLWMSSDRIDNRFWATFPNALLTAGINIRDVYNSQAQVDFQTSRQRKTFRSFLCHPAILLSLLSSVAGACYLLAVRYSDLVGSTPVLNEEDKITFAMQAAIGGFSFLASQYLSWQVAATRTGISGPTTSRPGSALSIASLEHTSGAFESKRDASPTQG